MMSFVLMLTLQCLFPIFDPDTEFTGVSVVNPDTQSQTFSVSVSSSDGSHSFGTLVSLQPGAQRVGSLKEIVPIAPTSGAGYIRIGPSLNSNLNNTCTSYVTLVTNEALTGVEGAPAPQPLFPPPPTLPPPVPTTLILPHISINTGFTELDYTDTRIALVNASFPPANITAQLFGTDGVLRGSVPLGFSFGSRVIRVSEAFQSLLPNNGLGGKTFEGYVRLVSNTQIAAWQRIETPLSASVLRGKSLDEIPTTSMATFPQFAFGGGYDSFINLLNPGSSPLRLELTAYNDQGNTLGDVLQITLAAGEERRASVSQIFRIPVIASSPGAITAGTIRIREAQAQPFQIVGDIQIVYSNGASRSAMLSSITDAGATLWMMPFAISSGGYFTGYAVANPDELLAVQTDVQLEVVNANGTVKEQTTIHLSPLNRTATLVRPGLPGGYLRFRSNFPIHVMGAVGTEDLRQLDLVPAIRQ
jgi:hypothetical protein